MKRNRIGAALLAGALALAPQAVFAAADESADAVAAETATGWDAGRPAPVAAAAPVAKAAPQAQPRAVDLTPKKTKAAPAVDASEQDRYVESESIFRTATLRRSPTTPSYRLFRGDSVNLLTVGFPNGIGLSGFTVGIDGYVQLPYVGSVKMEGLTLDEAKDVLMTSLNEYLKIPDMSLLITGYGPRKVYVMGEVKNPGIIELTLDNMNAYAALAAAGSWTRYGRSTKIQVLRVEDGIMYYRTLDMKAYAKHHDFTQNVVLEDGDILYVPKTNGIKFSDILPYFQAWTMYKAIVNN